MGQQFRAHLIALLASSFLACGNETDLSASDDGVDARADSSCLNCGLSPTVDESARFTPAQRLTLTPDTLMFYGDASVDEAEDVRDAQVVRIDNGTAQPVLLVSVSVQNDLYRVGGENGAEYFVAEDVSGVVLEPFGGSIELPVHFLGSSKQRSAWVQVQTNHPTFQLLRVAVTGKTFAGFDW